MIHWWAWASWFWVPTLFWWSVAMIVVLALGFYLDRQR